MYAYNTIVFLMWYGRNSRYNLINLQELHVLHNWDVVSSPVSLWVIRIYCEKDIDQVNNLLPF